MGEIEFLGDRTATIAGINIGGTNTTVVGGLEDGTIVSRWSAFTPVDTASVNAQLMPGGARVQLSRRTDPPPIDDDPGTLAPSPDLRTQSLR